MRSSKGFTLIELLIVIAIIAILASLILVSLGPARKSARDTQRVNDVRQVQSVVEIYASANSGTYPAVSSWSDLLGVLVTYDPNISTALANDPLGNPYYYSSDGTNYTLGAVLENDRGTSLRNHLSSPVISPGITCSDIKSYCIGF